MNVDYFPPTVYGLLGFVLLLGTQLVHSWLSARRDNQMNYQLTNSHGTNLRDDIDGIKRSVDALTKRLTTEHYTTSRDISMLRSEIVYERDRAMTSDETLSAQLFAERERSMSVDRNLQHQLNDLTK